MGVLLMGCCDCLTVADLQALVLANSTDTNTTYVLGAGPGPSDLTLTGSDGSAFTVDVCGLVVGCDVSGGDGYTTISTGGDGTVTITTFDADGVQTGQATFGPDAVLSCADVIACMGGSISTVTGGTTGPWTFTQTDGTTATIPNQTCTQFVNHTLDSCEFPLCLDYQGTSLNIANAADVQTWLDTIVPPDQLTGAGLSFDETGCRIYGCAPAAFNPADIAEVPPAGDVVLATLAGNLGIIGIVTSDGSPVEVTWPDGSTQTVPSNPDVTVSATGQPAGNVTISVAGCACVEMFRVAGVWAFSMDDLNQFKCLETFLAGAGNRTTGDIGDLPETLIIYDNQGNNTTTGDVAALPPGLVLFVNRGNNTTFGDVAGLPASLVQYRNVGNNTTTGDIGGLPAGMATFVNWGNNTVSGDIAGLPTGLSQFNVLGANTTTGDIADLPSTVVIYKNAGSNTVTGDLADLPAGLQIFWSTGQASVGGEIGTLPAGITEYRNGGAGVVTYAVPYAMAAVRRSFVQVSQTTGLSTAEVDQILIDIAANGLSAQNPRIITLDGLNAPRSTASDAAVATLTGNNWVVTTN